MSTRSGSAGPVRIGWLLLGGLLLGGFLASGESRLGMTVRYLTPQTNSSPGELHLWVRWLLLALPGATLIGAGLAGVVATPLARAYAALAKLDRRGRLVVAVVAAALTGVAAAAGRWFFLRGFPITDDEFAARFGGQVLATGHWTIPLPESWSAWPQLFLYADFERGVVCSFEWVGAQLAWAVAEWTRLGDHLFAIAAALTVAALVLGVSRRLNPGWGAVAALLFVLSPFAFSLSMTSHTHVISRCLLACFLLAWIPTSERPTALRGVVAGLLLGAALVTRPLEIALLTAPLLVHAAWTARADAGRRRGVVALVLGVAPWVLAAVLQNLAITGHPFVSARIPTALDLAGQGMHPPLALFTDPAVALFRFTEVQTYELSMLLLWFLGPLGLVLVLLGVGTDRLTRLLGIGVLLHLGLALIHDDPGLHVVGPMHYADTSIPLFYLAVHGLVRLGGMLRAAGQDPRRWAAAGLVGAMLGLPCLTVWNGMGLRAQAEIHRSLYALLDAPELDGAVVLAPPYAVVWGENPTFRQTGSFVFEWRRVRPGRDDRVVVVHAMRDELPAIARDFPGRPLYQMVRAEAEPGVRIVPLTAP